MGSKCICLWVTSLCGRECAYVVGWVCLWWYSYLFGSHHLVPLSYPGAAIVNPSFVLSAQRALEFGVGVPFWVLGRSDRSSPVIVVAVVCLVATL